MKTNNKPRFKVIWSKHQTPYTLTSREKTTEFVNGLISKSSNLKSGNKITIQIIDKG